MAYLNRRRARSAGSAELVGLLFVIAAGVAAAWMAGRSIGVDLSGVTEAAAFAGLVDRGSESRFVGFSAAPPASAVATAAPLQLAALPAPFCPAGQAAQFHFGFAELRRQLGDTMGTPVECEHVSSANGDTVQQTSTGLAIYRKSSNTPIFTNGWRHWALTTRGLVVWDGESTDPPTP